MAEILKFFLLILAIYFVLVGGAAFINLLPKMLKDIRERKRIKDLKESGYIPAPHTVILFTDRSCKVIDHCGKEIKKYKDLINIKCLDVQTVLDLAETAECFLMWPSEKFTGKDKPWDGKHLFGGRLCKEEFLAILGQGHRL